MSLDHKGWQGSERRSGADRRRADKGPPRGRRERRVGMEPRRPEVREVELTPSEWAGLLDDSRPAGSGGR